VTVLNPREKPFSASQAQEFPENPYLLFVHAFLGDRPTGSYFFRQKVKIFGFGGKYAEYSGKTNYSAFTEYLVSVKSRIRNYSVIW
jgi:hypothetical protein